MVSQRLPCYDFDAFSVCVAELLQEEAIAFYEQELFVKMKRPLDLV